MIRWLGVWAALAVGTAAAGEFEDCYNSPEDEVPLTSDADSVLRVTDAEMARVLAQIRRAEQSRIATQAREPGRTLLADTSEEEPLSR